MQLVNDCTRCVACGYDAVLLWDSLFARTCFVSSYQRLGELSSSFASTVAGFRVAPSNDGVRWVLVCMRMHDYVRGGTADVVGCLTESCRTPTRSPWLSLHPSSCECESCADTRTVIVELPSEPDKASCCVRAVHTVCST